MAKISKKEAHYQSGKNKGKLKKGYYYDKDGKLRKAQPVQRTRLYKAAAQLGAAGGKATARRQKRLF